MSLCVPFLIPDKGRVSLIRLFVYGLNSLFQQQSSGIEMALMVSFPYTNIFQKAGQNILYFSATARCFVFLFVFCWYLAAMHIRVPSSSFSNQKLSEYWYSLLYICMFRKLCTPYFSYFRCASKSYLPNIRGFERKKQYHRIVRFKAHLVTLFRVFVSQDLLRFAYFLARFYQSGERKGTLYLVKFPYNLPCEKWLLADNEFTQDEL